MILKPKNQNPAPRRKPAMTSIQTGVGTLVATSLARQVLYVAAQGPTALATSLDPCAMDMSIAERTWQ